MKFFGNLNMHIKYKCYFSLSYVGAVDVSASKMFLIDHASVSRILILAFFVLIVILATVLDLLGLVEKYKECKDAPEIEEINSSSENLLEFKKSVSINVDLNKCILEEEEPAPEEDTTLETFEEEDNDISDEIVDKVEVNKEEIIIQNSKEEDNEADFTTRAIIHRHSDIKDESKQTYESNSLKKDEHVEINGQPKEVIKTTDNQIQRTEYNSVSDRPQNHGIVKVLSDAGYRTVAVNMIGELGLDQIDQVDDGQCNEDDLSVSGWPTPLRPGVEPDITSILTNGDQLEQCVTNQDLPDSGSGSDTPTKKIISKTETDKTDSLVKLLHAFSIRRNLPKLFNIKESSEGELKCLHGIRFLSMTWVILGHTFFFSIPYLDNPIWALNKIQNSLSMEAVEAGLFAVDSFFFLSGLLVSYIFVKRKNSVGNVTNLLLWLKVILHRYLRLLPPYLALVLLLEPLLFYTCSGPLCPASNLSNCPRYWWRNVLNIQNFWDLKEMCAGWSWYLANDFQFFCLSPIFLVVLFTIPPLAWVNRIKF